MEVHNNFVTRQIFGFGDQDVKKLVPSYFLTAGNIKENAKHQFAVNPICFKLMLSIFFHIACCSEMRYLLYVVAA